MGFLLKVIFAILIAADVVSAPLSGKLDRIDRGIAVKTGIIFSEAVAEKNKLCQRPLTCWLPRPADIDVLEEHMPLYFLSSKEPGAAEIAKNLGAYKRKYFGFKRNGVQNILVVGICSMYWWPAGKTFLSLKRPLTDMGACFFELEFNLTTTEFSDLYIDGEA